MRFHLQVLPPDADADVLRTSRVLELKIPGIWCFVSDLFQNSGCTRLQVVSVKLSYALCRFLLEVTNEKSDLYPHETLYSLLLLLQMYLHGKGIYYKFMQDPDFADVRNTLDNHMKLSKLGMVTKKEKAQPFTLSEEEKMWAEGILGQDNPEHFDLFTGYALVIACSGWTESIKSWVLFSNQSEIQWGVWL